MTNRELIQLCLTGEKGQKLLYEKFVKKMARICLRYLRNAEDSQDVLIEGFLKVFDSIGKFEYRGENSLESWITRIMINQSLMFLRKRGSTFQETLSITHESSENDNTNLETEQIEAYIMSLPVGYRAVFNLYAVEGFSHKEIAKMLQISESASRSQLTRARSKLQELLKKGGWHG